MHVRHLRFAPCLCTWSTGFSCEALCGSLIKTYALSGSLIMALSGRLIISWHTPALEVLDCCFLPQSHCKKVNQIYHMQVTIALLRNAMIKSSSDRFLIDGFPRALDQAEIFERDVMPCQMVRLIASPTSCHTCKLQGPLPSCPRLSGCKPVAKQPAVQTLLTVHVPLYHLPTTLLGNHRAKECPVY